MTLGHIPERRLQLPLGQSSFASGIVHSNFSVQGDSRLSFLAWQERMDPVYHIRPPATHGTETFDASFYRYSIDNLTFFNIHTSQNVAERSLGRVSTENISDISFSLFLEGAPAQMKGYNHWLDTHLPSAPSVLAQDMNQPSTVRSFDGRLLVFFVPRLLMENVFPDAASLHARRVEAITPLTQLMVAHLVALNRQIGDLSKVEAESAFRTGVQLLAAAFSQQAGLSGSTRAAVRAAVYGQVRRYVEAHLDDHNLSANSVMQSLRLSRASVYRLFAHEGGLAVYISNRRLRVAADQLVRFPHIPVKDIAYGLGFNSASSFTRAFRRTYDMAPQGLHEHAQLLEQRQAGSKN
ncbi:AraC family transcriptional regulator [Glaciimonas soli]|uniref:Helix-turn-helix domain-containing protein n=1 Tax=Glaciimonas soli TaxID=2590999 RepID=A0A843YNI0_9BURK|nr:AraC family transcriptional regulator [Glaciimonas soli]MQQ99536.1 helix-turn-helix domain-containing protein [Glaciimonas soli]